MVIGIMAPLALLGSPTALWAQTGTVQLEPSSAAPGDSITVRAGGFRPGAVVEVSGPAGALARTTADSEGAIVMAVGIPIETSPGDWPLTLHGSGPSRERVELTGSVAIAPPLSGEPARVAGVSVPDSTARASHTGAPSDLARTGSLEHDLSLTGSLLVLAGVGMVLLVGRRHLVEVVARPERWSVRADDILPGRRRRLRGVGARRCERSHASG